jgi:hypothetical protein
MPEEFGEGPRFVTKFSGASRVVKSGFDLSAVANDTGVPEKPFDAALVPAGDSVDLKVGEGAPEIFSFSQNGEPGKTRLKAFETELFEESAIVANRKPPFGIVVFLIVSVIAAPAASTRFVGHAELA